MKKQLNYDVEMCIINVTVYELCPTLLHVFSEKTGEG